MPSTTKKAKTTKNEVIKIIAEARFDERAENIIYDVMEKLSSTVTKYLVFWIN